MRVSMPSTSSYWLNECGLIQVFYCLVENEVFGKLLLSCLDPTAIWLCDHYYARYY